MPNELELELTVEVLCLPFCYAMSCSHGLYAVSVQYLTTEGFSFVCRVATAVPQKISEVAEDSLRLQKKASLCKSLMCVAALPCRLPVRQSCHTVNA